MSGRYITETPLTLLVVEDCARHLDEFKALIEEERRGMQVFRFLCF